MTQDTIYVVISAQKVADRLKHLLDRGLMAQANQLSQELQGFYTTVKAFCQRHGGHLYVHLYERSVMEIPLSCADEVPQYFEQFERQFGGKPAIGLGFSMAEASKAMLRSKKTHEIELYDPKHDFSDQGETDLYLPREIQPNLYDPTEPPSSVPELAPKQDPVPKRMTIEQEQQAEQAMFAQMMPPPPQQPGMEQGEEEGQEERPQHDNLHQALSGKPAPHARKQESNAPESPEGSDEGEGDGKELEEEIDQAENEAKRFNGRLADTIHQVKTQLPQIMALQEQNPKAFKQAMTMISKLVSVAHSHGVAKAESDKFDELTKRFNERAKILTVRGLPVGSVFRGKKKVLVDGKQEWRSVKSGMVRGPDGQPKSAKGSQGGQPSGPQG